MVYFSCDSSEEISESVPVVVEPHGTHKVSYYCDSCTGEEIYGENSKEVEQLRYFRDNVLSKALEGQEIIKLYYQWSPVIVEAMVEDEAFKKEVKELIDGILPLIRGEVK